MKFCKKVYSFVVKKIKGCLTRITEKNRKIFRKIQRARLINKNPTIIANNCFGTFIYHDMNLRFNSPTINLWLKNNEFLNMVKNLKGFMESDVTEIKEEGIKYPVGQIKYNNETVNIYFMHYNTFEEARMKWNERKKRIDYSNLHVILQLQTQALDDVTYNEFKSVPYNKMLIAKENLYKDKEVVVHKVLSKEGYRAGEILEYKGTYSYKRYMDEIDYVSFLNKNYKK